MQGVCKNCKFEGSILKHISRNKTCFEKYHKEELDAFDRKKKEIKNEKQRLQYSPNKRRQAYLIKVDKKKSSLHLDTSNTSENKMLIKDATKDNDSKNIVKWTKYSKDLKGRRLWSHLKIYMHICKKNSITWINSTVMIHQIHQIIMRLLTK